MRPWHAATAAYLVALVVYVVEVGIPIDRGLQTVWILAGMAAWQVGRPPRQWLRMLADWLPFFAALLVYDHTRGVADTLGRPVLVQGLVDAERAVFGGALPTLVLQEQFYDRAAVQWFDVVAAVVYFSHFFVAWTIAAVLYVRSRQAWLQYAKLIFTLTYLGLLTYVLLPAAPPWYAAWQELIPDVDRTVTRGWWALGLQNAGQLIERGQADVNLVAALPSLHAGTSMLVVLWAWTRVGSPWARAGLATYAVAMGATLVYGGEHYVLDVLMGWAYAAAVVAGWRRWDERRDRLSRERVRGQLSPPLHGASDVPCRAGSSGSGTPDFPEAAGTASAG